MEKNLTDKLEVYGVFLEEEIDESKKEIERMNINDCKENYHTKGFWALEHSRLGILIETKKNLHDIHENKNLIDKFECHNDFLKGEIKENVRNYREITTSFLAQSKKLYELNATFLEEEIRKKFYEYFSKSKEYIPFITNQTFGDKHLSSNPIHSPDLDGTAKIALIAKMPIKEIYINSFFSKVKSFFK